MNQINKNASPEAPTTENKNKHPMNTHTQPTTTSTTATEATTTTIPAVQPTATSAPAPTLQGVQLTLGAESSLASIHVVAEAATAPDQSPLAEAEQLELRQLEGAIRSGLKTYIKVGEALGEIQRKRLYRFEHASFEDYCVSRWGFRRAHAYRLIKASKTARTLSPIGDTGSPAVESHARLINKLPAEQREGAMARAKALAGDKKVTTALVKQATAEIRQANAPAPAAAMPATTGIPRPTVVFGALGEANPESTVLAQIAQLLREGLEQVRQSQSWTAAISLLDQIEAALQSHSPTVTGSVVTGNLIPSRVGQPASQGRQAACLEL